MNRNLRDYWSIKKSGLFDPFIYLYNNPDVRLADVDPLMHFVKTGWKEGRNPSADFDINGYLVDFPELLSKNINPLVHFIKRENEESRSYRPNTLKELLHFHFKGFLFFVKLSGVVFFAGYPYPERERDGYYQRVRSIDNLFLDRWRVYIDLVNLPGRKSWYDFPAPKTLVLRPQIKGNRFLARMSSIFCILRCKTSYFHSILSAGGVGRNPIFWYLPLKKRILDMHGVVPEEFDYKGEKRRAIHFQRIERRIISRMHYLVVVTDAMKNHVEKKYPGLFKGQYITLPIFQELNMERTDKQDEPSKPVIVYAGGLQKWQQVPKMIDVMEKTYDFYSYRFYCPEPEKMIAMLPKALRDNKKIHVGSRTPSELLKEYPQCHYGFILREDIIVNQVSCPTKVIEYLANGIVPVVDSEKIGDFANMSMQYVRLKDLADHRLPEESKRKEMVNINYDVYKKLMILHKTGVVELIKAVNR